jgi:tetratricopeptide (TPR) repeat protein
MHEASVAVAPPEMTLPEARNILGLGPDEDPRPHLAEFQSARERIAAMVRGAPNEQLAMRYQKGLVEFDQALAAVREHFQGPAPEPPPMPEPEEIALPEPEEAAVKKQAPRRGVLSWLAWLLVFLTGAAGGGWIYFMHEREKQRLIGTRIEFLERSGAVFVENRRWQDAARLFAEIETLEPGSATALRGRREIQSGMDEERKQFIGYWTGQAIAELDAGRYDEAEASTRRVLQNFPSEAEALVILERVAKAREGISRTRAIAAARRLLDERQWQTAINAARRMLDADPADSEAATILADASEALEKERADRARSVELYRMAVERDRGEFDQEALDWLREATSLAPTDPVITELYEKMASYTRTLRVPGDFATPAEALEAARDRDRIVLGEHIWKGPLVINAAIELQGAGSAATIIECPPAQGCPITIGPDARGRGSPASASAMSRFWPMAGSVSQRPSCVAVGSHFWIAVSRMPAVTAWR